MDLVNKAGVEAPGRFIDNKSLSASAITTQNRRWLNWRMRRWYNQIRANIRARGAPNETANNRQMTEEEFQVWLHNLEVQMGLKKEGDPRAKRRKTP